MNYKIIETESEFPDVLLYRSIDEEGQEIVSIIAIGTSEDEIENTDYFAEEIVAFGDINTAQCFIKDFSIYSAQNWCTVNKIIY